MIAALYRGTWLTVYNSTMQFDLSDLTHRRNILDPSKLEYLNRRHLQLKASTPNTFGILVDRSVEALRTSYPNRSAKTCSAVRQVLRLTF